MRNLQSIVFWTQICKEIFKSALVYLKYNIRLETFFLKYHTQNKVEKLFSDPFLKNQNWAYLWSNSLKFYTFFFFCMLSCGLSKYTETKLQTTCFYHIQSFFKKQKEVWHYSLWLIFSIIFDEKYFSCYILLPDQISLFGCLYFVRY